MSNVEPTLVDRLQPVHEPGQRYKAGALVNEKYLLEARLGAGGMGTVWLAQNVLLESSVALKLIHLDVQGDETIERFRLEARVVARFRHPNIVRVFDFGHTELGDPFMVMEVLDGITLGDMIRQRGHLGSVEAVQAVLPIVDALCHVHARGVVHRDIKPDNILLSRDDADTSPKLLDFGVAKLIDGTAAASTTQAGALIGSPPYMAPEQAQGDQAVDYRADIWAICVVLYEAISGQRAFPGEGHAALRSVIEGSVTPFEDVGHGRDELFQILLQGLEKDPTLRFQSMVDLGTALAQWLYDRGEREDLNGSRISRTWPVVTAQAPRERRETREMELSAHLGCAVDDVALAVHGGSRRWLSRAAVVTAIVLAAIAIPSNLRIESARPGQVAYRAQVLVGHLIVASADALETAVPRAKAFVSRAATRFP
jgi:serine/threonine protein kinase